jgi:hypothetical protein
VTILSLPPAAAADDQEEGAEHIRRPPEPRELDVSGQKTFENELHPQSQPFVTAASAHQMATTQHNAPIENNISRPRRTFFFLFAQANKRRTPAAASAHSSQVRPEVPPIKTHPILFGVALLNETNYISNKKNRNSFEVFLLLPHHRNKLQHNPKHNFSQAGKLCEQKRSGDKSSDWTIPQQRTT